MHLGDVKPASLREIEVLIWKDLFLVTQCKLSAEDMLNHVLGEIVDPVVLVSFRMDRHKLRDHFQEKFQPKRDHLGFFIPSEFSIA